jgi:hypothetical protein
MWRVLGLVSDDETQASLVKKQKPQGLPFSHATLKDFVSRHIVKKETQFSQESLDLLNRVFDEVGGWIVRESERMAAIGGGTRVSAEHVRDAAKLYLSWEEGK